MHEFKKGMLVGLRQDSIASSRVQPCEGCRFCAVVMALALLTDLWSVLAEDLPSPWAPFATLESSSARKQREPPFMANLQSRET